MKDNKNDTLGNMATFQKPLLTFQNRCYWYDSPFLEDSFGAIIHFTGLNQVINMMLIRTGSKPTSSVTVKMVENFPTLTSLRAKYLFSWNDL